jgi:hypothetical protein
MRDLLQLSFTDRTENQARVMITPKQDSNIARISGLIRGPYCDFSKTLTADFILTSSSASTTSEALIMEPCYWTRQLPFWYDLRLAIEFVDGKVQEDVVSISLRRFYCDGQNFRWESKRTVLRGLKYESPTEHETRAARQFEAVLIVADPTEDLCEIASKLGVPLIADLRETTMDLREVLEVLAWQPAVLMVLLRSEQLAESHSAGPFVAVCLDANSGQLTIDCDAFAVELSGEERPPRWLSTCGKPVIAIHNEGFNEIRTARADCDRLQAALAPEFNLAGYFV